MKDDHATQSRFWRIISAALATIVVAMPFHAFLSTWYGTLIGPLWLWKSWKELLLVVLTAMVLGWVIWRRRAKEIFTDTLILILCTYAILVLTLTLFTHDQLDAKLAGIAMDLRYFIIFGLAYCLARFAPELRRLWLLRTPRLIVLAGLILATLGILQVTVMPLHFLERFGYDKDTTIAPYLLIDNNEHAPRAFATLRGPNDFGAYLVLPLAVALGFLVKIRDKIFISLALVAGLAVSASRSAWIAALATVLTAIAAAKQIATKKLVLVGSGAAIVVIIALFAAVSIPAVRLAVFHSSPGDSSLTEGSTDAHWAATMNGVNRVIEQPLGCGAGCAGPASYYGDAPRISENYYVQIAENYGVLGLVIWLAIFGLVMFKLWKHEEKLSVALFASGVGLALIGFWLHVWSDDPIALTWWALAGIVLGVASKTGTKPVQ